MLDHVGDVFEGVIASVTNFGFFVRLTEFNIDGLVHITALKNDYYQFDAVKQHLVGEKTGTVYRLGDPLEVKVAAVNLDERKIDFVLEGAEQVEAKKPRQAKKRGPAKKSGKQGTIASEVKTPATKASAPGTAKKSRKPKPGAKPKSSRHGGK